MSNGGGERDTSVSVTDQPSDGPSGQGEEAEAKAKRKLELDVQIQDVGPCKKHLKVTVPRPEIERQFEESLGNFQRDAQVPGFGPAVLPGSLLSNDFASKSPIRSSRRS